MENHTNKTYQERMNKTASSKFDAIEKHLDKGVKLLDFGSGFSPEFIDQVQQTGAYYTAYDVSQIVQNHNRNVDHQYVEANIIFFKKFDSKDVKWLEKHGITNWSIHHMELQLSKTVKSEQELISFMTNVLNHFEGRKEATWSNISMEKFI